jgi:hypothetical protein
LEEMSSPSMLFVGTMSADVVSNPSLEEKRREWQASLEESERYNDELGF